MDGTEGTSQRSLIRISEADFTLAVIELATYRGWMVAHFRPARTEKGWRTPMQGHTGFPDLVLARRGTTIFAELKTEKGRVTAAQRRWHDQLGNCRIWRPSMMNEITRELM